VERLLETIEQMNEQIGDADVELATLAKKDDITKAGSPAMRRALVQAAWGARRARGAHPMVHWSLEVEKRRGKRVAVLALARKMAGIMYRSREGNTISCKRLRPVNGFQPMRL
jgi:hypothetical protein